MKLLLSVVIFTSVWAQASVHITTYNLKKFKEKNSTRKLKTLFQELKKVPFDIIAFQEIVDDEFFKEKFTEKYPGFALRFNECGGAGRQLLATAYNKKKYKLVKSYEDKKFSKVKISGDKSGCGYLRSALRLKLQDKKSKEIFNIMNVHLKAGNRLDSASKRWMQYDLITRYLKSKRIKNLIVLGDFNSTGYLDRNADYNAFEAMIEETNYKTSADELNCSAFWAGYNRRDNEEVPSLLDHILYQSNFLNFNTEKIRLYSHCKRVKCYNSSRTELGGSYRYASDHCPVSIEFN